MFLFESTDDVWLEQIIKKYKGLVISTISIFIKNQYDVEEVAADVFYKIWSQKEKIESKGTSECTAFVNVIAKYTAIDFLRKHKKDEDLLYIDSLDIEILSEWEEILIDIGEIKIGDYIDSYVEQLPEDQQYLLWLHYFQKFQYKEIASMLKIETDVVKKRTQRSIAKLREIIKKGGRVK